MQYFNSVNNFPPINAAGAGGSSNNGPPSGYGGLSMKATGMEYKPINAMRGGAKPANSLVTPEYEAAFMASGGAFHPPQPDQSNPMGRVGGLPQPPSFMNPFIDDQAFPQLSSLVMGGQPQPQ